MNFVALKMLTGDRAKYLGLIFAIAFCTFLLENQTSIFASILKRTGSQILDVTDADVWVMDAKTEYFEQTKALKDTDLTRVRGVTGVEWALKLWRHQQHERKLKMETKLQVSKNVTINKPDEKRQGMKVRTVVTGHDAKGRAVFVRDEQVGGTPIPGLGELAFLWNADEPATYPNAGNNPAAPGIFPPVGGIRYIIGTYLPGVIAPEPTPEMHLEDGDEPGGANDGFHRTDTTDFGVLLSGNMALELDDGAEVVLSPGDVLIENGTRHRWRVVGDVPATLASFIIGARRG